mmetsp:Transcript_2186/g.5752  ORF Transcript_2186/g.5752 Transcript_2186/m.5752 type:complete len:194 (+) Transcript_2186:138-719(+)
MTEPHAAPSPSIPPGPSNVTSNATSNVTTQASRHVIIQNVQTQTSATSYSSAEARREEQRRRDVEDQEACPTGIVLSECPPCIKTFWATYRRPHEMQPDMTSFWESCCGCMCGILLCVLVPAIVLSPLWLVLYAPVFTILAINTVIPGANLERSWAMYFSVAWLTTIITQPMWKITGLIMDILTMAAAGRALT